MARTHIVIMAGGIGKRLAPLSTPEKPKQFLDLLETGKTLIQMTYERCKEINPNAVFWVVTSEQYFDLVREQVPEIYPWHILLEPESKNTAPCIAYASWRIYMEDPDALVMVVPADAYIESTEMFVKSIQTALPQVEDGIVCVGIKPTGPSTEYGYIEVAQKPRNNDFIVPVASFTEKPDAETATKYLISKTFWWNAGIFIWKVQTVLDELRTYVPDIYGAFWDIHTLFTSIWEKEAVKEVYKEIPKISIDYAVMEKSNKIKMLAVDWNWSDLGSFEAIEKVTGHKIAR